MKKNTIKRTPVHLPTGDPLPAGEGFSVSIQLQKIARINADEFEIISRPSDFADPRIKWSIQVFSKRKNAAFLGTLGTSRLEAWQQIDRNIPAACARWNYALELPPG